MGNQLYSLIIKYQSINIRKHILIEYCDSKKIRKDILNFLIALGSQCFLNEYVFFMEEDEKQKLKSDYRKACNLTDKPKELWKRLKQDIHNKYLRIKVRIILE